MQISVYTRHSPKCSHRADSHYRRCRCPKWHYCAEWRKTQRSARTRSWAEAEARARKLEAPLGAQPVALADAIKGYLADILARGLTGNYHGKLTRELADLQRFCDLAHVTEVSAILLKHLEEFRSTWKGSSGTRSRQQQRLRGFFSYCVRHGWITINQAKHLSPIKIKASPTRPFTKEEYATILAGAPDPRTRVFLELLRWSGLRMGDACRLTAADLRNGRVLLYMAKTGEPVYVPLPPRLVDDLNSIHFTAPRWGYDNWHKKLTALFKKAGLSNAHPHQLRDTFAVELLLAGVPLDQVSMLLGHTTIKTTEKHYAPWVKARQQQLELSVQKTWTEASGETPG
jgi:integrase